jgi:sulfur-oxidizing protein SoxX
MPNAESISVFANSLFVGPYQFGYIARHDAFVRALASFSGVFTMHRMRKEQPVRNRFSVYAGSALFAASMAEAAIAAEPVKEESAKEIIFSASKGNCLACHMMPTLNDAVQPGNSGPPLIAMSARFPDRAVLRAKIWDATASRPDSLMPPFGKHKVLTEEQIDKIVEFIYVL